MVFSDGSHHDGGGGGEGGRRGRGTQPFLSSTYQAHPPPRRVLSAVTSPDLNNDRNINNTHENTNNIHNSNNKNLSTTATPEYYYYDDYEDDDEVNYRWNEDYYQKYGENFARHALFSDLHTPGFLVENSDLCSSKHKPRVFVFINSRLHSSGVCCVVLYKMFWIPHLISWPFQ